MTKIRSKFFLQEQMTYQNAQFRNFGNDEGDILNFFNEHLRNLVAKNGGDNTFAMYCEDFHDHDIPIEKFSERTRIKLTHPNHTISQIEKSFIEMTVEFDVFFQTPLTKTNFWTQPSPGTWTNHDQAHINQIFVGFKDAVEIIDEARFYVDGKLVQNYHQTEMIRESYAYNSIRSKESKQNSPHSHTLWENVCNLSPNVCGVYIPLSSLASINNFHVVLDLIIPFTDQLALQAWRLYPNQILGEIEEEVRFSLDGLVWCQVPPQKVGDRQKKKLYYQMIEYHSPEVPIINRFLQIGQLGKIVSSFEVNIVKNSVDVSKVFAGTSSTLWKLNNYNESSTTAESNTTMNQVFCGVMENRLIVNPKSIKITVGRSNLFGFGIKPSVVEGLMSTLQEPLIIPSQELTRVIFDTTVGDDEINLIKSMPLKNATNLTFMFPRYANDITVYRNIMYANVRLIIDKKLYPQVEFANTWNGRFVQYQLMANELDGIEATPEYLESICQPLNNIIIENSQIRGDWNFHNSYYDDTNFGINFQLERGNSGYVFDGIDTDNHEALIKFHADSIFDWGHQLENSYLFPTHDFYGRNLCKPEMWICSDTYWTWSIQDGVQYHDEGVPSGYK